MPRTILTLVLFLGAIAIVVFYLWPQFGVYQAVRSDTKILEHVLAELESAEGVLDALDGKIQAVPKANLDRIEAALPKGASGNDLIRMMEYYGFAHRVAIKSMQVEDGEGARGRASGSETTPRPAGSGTQGEKAEKEITMNIQAAGTYADIRNFLDALEKNIRIIDVASVSFGGFDSPSQIIPVSIKAKTYYQ